MAHALALLLVAVAVGQGAVLVLGQQVLPLYDGHYARSINYEVYLGTLDPTFLQRHGEMVFSDRVWDPARYPLYMAYPPLFYLWTAAVYAVAGVSVASARLAVVLSGVVLLGALYDIGRTLGGRTGGLAVLALAITAPVALHTSRLYVLDYPQAATTALALALLLRTDGFRHRGWSLALGLGLALAMLTKWSAAYFLALPLLASAVAAPGRDRRAWLAWLAVPAGLGSLAVAMVVANRLCQRPDQWVGQGWWLGAWLLGAVVPGVVITGLLLRRERAWRAEPGYAGAPTRRVVNLVLSGTVGVVLATPWYAWALGDVRANLATNTGHFEPPGLAHGLSLASQYLAHAVLLGGPLLLLGLVAAVAGRGPRRWTAVFATSLALVMALLLQTGDPDNFLELDIQNRLSAGLVVFVAPLAGAWLGHVGRAGQVATAGLVGAALVLVTGWLHSPNAGPAWRPVFGPFAEEFFAPRNPVQAEREIPVPDALIAMLAQVDRSDRTYEHAYIVASPTLPRELNWDDLYTRTLLEAGKLMAWDRISPGVTSGNYAPMLQGQAERLPTLDYIVLVTTPGQPGPQQLLADLARQWPPGGRIAAEGRISGDLYATVVELGRP